MVFREFKQGQGGHSGFTLVEVLLAIAITSILSLGFSSEFKSTLTSTQALSKKIDREGLRAAIIRSVNCSETLRDVDVESMCSSDSSNQVPPYLDLKRLTPFGPRSIGSGTQRADGSYRFGNFLVRASCSRAERSLIVKALPLPTDRRAENSIDWNAPQALIVGSGIGVPKCFSIETIGSTAQFVRKGGELVQLFGPTGSQIASNTGGDTIDTSVGIRCNADAGWYLTGCFKSSNNATVNEELVVRANDQHCFTDYLFKGAGRTSALNFEFTAVCLKVR